MALTALQILTSTVWVQTNPVTGFSTAKHPGGNEKSVLPTVSAAAANRVYITEATLAASASITIDLRSLTEPVFREALTPVRGYSIQLIGTGSAWRLDPGAANPLQWFFGGTTQQINGGAGAMFCFADPTAVTINATNRNIRITNTGGGTLTYTLVVSLGV